MRGWLGEDNYDLDWVEGVGGTRFASTRRSGRDRELRRGRGAGRRARADRQRRVHRQPLHARGLRDGLLRVLPHAGDGRSRSRRRSSTRPTSASRWTTSSLEPVSSCTWHVHSESEQGQGPARGWPSPTGFSCTGPATGRAPSASRTVGLEVASGLKPLRAAEIENRLIRGPARMAEIFALLPEIRRRLPEAQLPFQRPAVAAAMVGSAAAVRLVRGSKLVRCAGDPRRRAGRRPAAVAMRGSNLADYHGAEHISIGTYEHGEERAKEHERCGSHVLGPLLLTSAVGNAPRAGARRLCGRGPRGGRRRRARGVGGALLLDGANEKNPIARALAMPGPRAPAPLRHRRAHARAARGREPGPGRVPPPRIRCKWR